MALAVFQYDFIYQNRYILLTPALDNVLKQLGGNLGISPSERVIPHTLEEICAQCRYLFQWGMCDCT